MATEVQVAEGSAAAVTASSSAMTATAIVDVHPDTMMRTLSLLDGPALAAASSVNSQLRSLASDQALWLNVCLATWPSLRSHPELLRQIIPSFTGAYRCFFSDAFPSPSFSSFSVTVAAWKATSYPSELISAVDLLYKGVPVFSGVVETDTTTHMFQAAPLIIGAIDRKEDFPSSPLLALGSSPEDLSLSWVVVDPASRRAVNLTSRRPVVVERHVPMDKVVVRFPAVIGGGSAAIGAVVVYWEGSGKVETVALMAESRDGAFLNGLESQAVIAAAMRGARRRWEGKAEERRRWKEFVAMRELRKEAAAGRERWRDLACSAVGAAVFWAFLVYLLFG